MWDAPWHWVVVAIVVIALFGYKRLPDAARSLGRSLRIFKTEIKGMGEDDKKRSEAQIVEPPKSIAASAPAPTVTPDAAAPRPRPTPAGAASPTPPAEANAGE